MFYKARRGDWSEESGCSRRDRGRGGGRRAGNRHHPYGGDPSGSGEVGLSARRPGRSTTYMVSKARREDLNDKVFKRALELTMKNANTADGDAAIGVSRAPSSTFVATTNSCKEVLNAIEREDPSFVKSLRLRGLEKLASEKRARAINAMFHRYNALQNSEQCSLLHHVKTFAQTILLKPGMEQAYTVLHTAVWPEVLSSLRAIGVLNMQIFLLGDRLFMHMTTKADFVPEVDFKKHLEMNDRCKEWGELTKTFQQPVAEAKEHDWWTEMKEVFDLAKAHDAAERVRRIQ